jgi:hypothetical protein
LEEYILSEMNVEKLVVSQDKHKYGVQLKAEPNFRLLGARLKAEQKAVANYLKVGDEKELLFDQQHSFTPFSEPSDGGRVGEFVGPRQVDSAWT